MAARAALVRGKVAAGAVHPAELLGTFGTSPTEVQVWLAEVEYADGGRETYQVPLRHRHRSDDALDHARVGQLTDADGRRLRLRRHVGQAAHPGVAARAERGADGAGERRSAST